MKFLHTGDLHIGKIVNEFSMLPDQKYILNQISGLAVSEQADAVIIAGDVYDRAIPSVEAVELLDEFLTGLLANHIPVLMISGNHDCGERVAFADKILEKQGLHIAGGYGGEPKRVVLEDEYGAVDFVCLPFVKPAAVGAKTGGEAVERLLGSLPMTADAQSRHVLVSHFFVTGEQGEEPEFSDAETTIHVGGLDNVPVSLFQAFDYVALGHIHKPQKIGAGEVYYAGAPLKYAFSEANSHKSVNIVTMCEKGKIQVEKRVLKPLHEMRILRGTLEELLHAGEKMYAGGDMPVGEETTADRRQDYIQAVLTDEVELIDPIGTLRSVYPNVMQIVMEKNMRESENNYHSQVLMQQKSIGELFGDFYEMLRGEPLDEPRRAVIRQAAAEAERGKKA